jgi:hypothetical protein
MPSARTVPPARLSLVRLPSAHHGFAMLGTIGFERHLDYAVIGTVSNVASSRTAFSGLRLVCRRAISPRAAQNLQHFAPGLRATVSARSKYPSAFAGFLPATTANLARDAINNCKALPRPLFGPLRWFLCEHGAASLETIARDHHSSKISGTRSWLNRGSAQGT